MRRVVLKTLDQPNRAWAREAFPVPPPSRICMYSSTLQMPQPWEEGMSNGKRDLSSPEGARCTRRLIDIKGG